MSVSLVLLITMAVLVACGIYLMLERSMTRVLIGFLLVGNGVNLLILIMGGPVGLAPFAVEGVSPEQLSDPLPQAFILTSIVITFGVSAFLLALIYRSWRLAQADLVQDDVEDLAIAARKAHADVDDIQEVQEVQEDTEFGSTRAEAAVLGSLDLDAEAEREDGG